MTQFNLCVIGQFNIDAVASDIGEGSYFRLGHNLLRFGGAVANLGEHAGDAFARVTAVFPVGDDIAGDMLRTRAADLFDDYAAIEIPGTQSGVVLILFENEGRRMVGPARASSSHLPADCLNNECQALIRSTDVVVIDGYLLLGENGPDVVCSALDTAHSAGTLGVVDLVPHDLPRHVPTEVFTKTVAKANVLVGELRTIAPFFAIDEDAAAVSRRLFELNPSLTAILRYGEHHISTNHIVSCDRETIEHHDGSPEELTQFGYGDRKLVSQLVTMLEARP